MREEREEANQVNGGREELGRGGEEKVAKEEKGDEKMMKIYLMQMVLADRKRIGGRYT